MRFPLIPFLLASAIAIAMPGFATAQQLGPVAPGVRVRLTVNPKGSLVVGDFVGRRGDSLEIWTRKAATQVIASDQVSRIEVSTGVRRARLKSALYGGAAGAALGLIIGSVVNGGDKPSALYISTRAASQLIWTSVGFGFGFVTGSAFTLTNGERWVPATIH